eukprot:g10571.t1
MHAYVNACHGCTCCYKGFVEFVNKGTRDKAFMVCKDKPFLLGRFPKPVIVRPFEYTEKLIGYTEAMVKHGPLQRAELSMPPR